MRGCSLQAFFYAWGEREYAWVILLSITVNYLLGIWLNHVRGRKWANPVFALAICLNIGMLVYFKYANFLAGNLNIALSASYFRILTPIGMTSGDGLLIRKLHPRYSNHFQP